MNAPTAATNSNGYCVLNAVFKDNKSKWSSDDNNILFKDKTIPPTPNEYLV